MLLHEEYFNNQLDDSDFEEKSVEADDSGNYEYEIGITFSVNKDYFNYNKVMRAVEIAFSDTYIKRSNVHSVGVSYSTSTASKNIYDVYIEVACDFDIKTSHDAFKFLSIFINGSFAKCCMSSKKVDMLIRCVPIRITNVFQDQTFDFDWDNYDIKGDAQYGYDWDYAWADGDEECDVHKFCQLLFGESWKIQNTIQSFGRDAIALFAIRYLFFSEYENVDFIKNIHYIGQSDGLHNVQLKSSKRYNKTPWVGSIYRFNEIECEHYENPFSPTFKDRDVVNFVKNNKCMLYIVNIVREFEDNPDNIVVVITYRKLYDNTMVVLVCDDDDWHCTKEEMASCIVDENTAISAVKKYSRKK